LNAIFPNFRTSEVEAYATLIVSTLDPKNAIMLRVGPDVVEKSTQLSETVPV